MAKQISSVSPLAIGIDLGGTGTKFGIVDRNGNILFSDEISTKGHKDVQAFIEELHKALHPLIEKAGGAGRIKGIGLGAPNGNFYSGTIEYAPNLHWRGIIPLANMVSKKFGLPCSLTNDANAAAVGEMMYGAARGMKDFIMITLGTGVGSGIVANGQLVLGHDGFAGELGHTTIRPGGRKHWGTDMYGSLEAYASATGIALTAKELLERHPGNTSLMRKYLPDQIDAKAVFECASKGDELANEVYRFTGEILGEALANFIMFSSPEAIVLFGGVIKAGDLLMKPTKEHMEKNLLPIFQNKVRLVFSE